MTGSVCATVVVSLRPLAGSGCKTLPGWADPGLVALKVHVEIRVMQLQLSVELITTSFNCNISSPRESLKKVYSFWQFLQLK